MKIVDLDQFKEGDATLSPRSMFTGILQEMDDGLEVDRAVVVIERCDGELQIYGSGWHGDDKAPGVYLLEAGKQKLIWMNTE